jgi:DNA-binding CsgD family transcriptional regulator
VFGREPEQRWLDAGLFDARDEHAWGAVLEGLPGTGKTTLLSYAEAGAVAKGFQVVRLAGSEWDAAQPFTALADLVRALRGELGIVPPGSAALLNSLLVSGGETRDPLGFGAALIALLTAAAGRKPLAILVDDVQWVDRATITALTFAFRRLPDDALAIVAAGRSVPPEMDRWPRRRIGGLGPIEARALLSSVAPGISLDHAVVARLVTETAGNPLALSELAVELDAHQLTGRMPLPAVLPLGPDGQASFGSALRGLGPGEILALAVAAAAGNDGQAMVTEALDLLGRTRADLDAAEQAGIIQLSAEQVTFRHPLLLSASLAALPPTDLRRIHAALASLYEERDAPKRAWHLGQASIGPSEELARAWERAAALGPAQARADALERAALASTPGPLAAERLVIAAESACATGSIRDAERLVQLYEHQGAADRTGPLDARVLVVRADCAFWWGRLDGVRDALETGMASLGDVDPGIALRLRCQLMLLAQNEGRLADAYAIAKGVEETPDGLPAPVRRVVESMVGNVSIVFGRRHEVRAWLDAWAGDDHENDTATPRGIEDLLRCQALLWSERHAGAEQWLERIARDQREYFNALVLSFVLVVQGDHRWWRGNWALGLAVLDESHEICGLTGQNLLSAFASGLSARIHAARGDEAAARSTANEALDRDRLTGSTPSTLYAVHALGLLELGLGNLDAALLQLERAEALRMRFGNDEETVVPYVADLIEVLIRLGNEGRARQLIERTRDGATTRGSRYAANVAHRSAGLMAGSLYDSDFESALAVLDPDDPPFERARTHLLWAEQLHQDGRIPAAQEHAVRAHTVFATLGASPWQARAQRLLGPRPTGAAGPVAEPLTGQELQVCLAVAQGLSNREVAAQLFISAKTVEHHLTRAYRKLGLRSRSQLTRAVGEGRLRGA